MTDAELMYASDEDVQFFLRVTEGLPKIEGFSKDGRDSNGEPMPFGTGPHSVKCLREIVSIVKPKEIFEVGFNVGYSSVVWLELAPESRIISVDISNRAETIAAAELLIKRYPKRIHVQIIDSARIKDSSMMMEWMTNVKWDLAFIDGGHLEHHVVADIELCVALKIKYLAFDDILPQFGPGVMSAIMKYPQLELVKEMGNIALYKNTTV